MMENPFECERCARAWAAGLFDGEGSAATHTAKGRRSQPELFVYQAGRSDAPEVLVRFREIVECGSVLGPYRARLWCWRAGSAREIARVATMLWPWLGAPKREQFASIGRRVAALAFLSTVGEVWDSIDASPGDATSHGSTVAWAGGFFVGEGSVSCRRATVSNPWPQLAASITQAGIDTAPALLERFRCAVDGLGTVGGPYVPSSAWSRKPQFRWMIGSESGTRRVIALLWPWLDARKRTQARVAFESFDYDHRRLGSRGADRT